MADLLGDGNIKVWWLASVGNVHAPTVAELNAGTALEPYITTTGLKITPSTAGVVTTKLVSTDETGAPGRRTFAISIEFMRQTPTDVLWNLFPYKAAGFLVVRRTTAAGTAWATGQSVEVYPTATGEPVNQSSASNEVQKATSDFMLSSGADTRAVVA